MNRLEKVVTTVAVIGTSVFIISALLLIGKNANHFLFVPTIYGLFGLFLGPITLIPLSIVAFRKLGAQDHSANTVKHRDIS